MKYREVTTQSEFDAAVAAGDGAVVRSGWFEASGSASVTAYDSASVRASGSASITASGSASVRAYDSASVTASDSASVTAYGSASVTAYDSASVTASGSASVTASGSASVTAYDSASVRASKYVAIQRHGTRATVEGGVVIQIPLLLDFQTWCDFYGVEIVDGHAIVIKAVHQDLRSGYGLIYPIGQTVTAEDWRPTNECGNGLHFGATPHQTLVYHDSPGTRYLACRVAVVEVVVIHMDGVSDKIKARACDVLYEVDCDGEQLLETVEATTPRK